MTFVEQRKHERVAVDIHVYWGWTYDCPFHDRIISLSEGGYFLRTARGAARGQPVFIKFWLPEQRTLCGEVRYHLERWASASSSKVSPPTRRPNSPPSSSTIGKEVVSRQ